MEKCFRSTLTGLVCALLILTFFTATAQAQAVAGGFSVSLNKQEANARDYVVMGGNNQKVGNIALTYIDLEDAEKLRRYDGIDQTLTVKFSDLKFASEPTLHMGTTTRSHEAMGFNAFGYEEINVGR